MKKIILISDCKCFTSTAIQFLTKLPQEGKLFILGEFAQSRNFEELIESVSTPYMRVLADLIEQDREALEENILLFTRSCRREGISYRVNKEYHPFEIDMLVKESRFADLMIISSNLVHPQKDGKYEPVLKDLLTKSECPLLILPQNYSPVKRVVVAYDGKKESMFALKQFFYLFPVFTHLPTEMVYLGSEETVNVPNVGSLKEYVIPNISDVDLVSIPIQAKKELSKWASEKKDAIFLAGSYSEKDLMGMSQEHFIDPIIDLGLFPVFIAHS
jgi:hypothetical protein